MQIKDTTTAYELFIQAHADYLKKPADQVKAEVSPEHFEEQLHNLHQRYMAGEFSFGRFTELIGVPHWELWEILGMIGLPLHN